MSLGAVATNDQLEGLALQVFLWVTGSGAAISARDVQVFLRMLDNGSWCQSRWARENLYRTRERHASAWSVEALSRMRRDLEELHAGLRSVRSAVPAGELAAVRTDLLRLAEATARATGGGLLGQGGLRRERRDALLVFSSLSEAILLPSEDRLPPVAPPPPGAPAGRARRQVRCVQVIDETADVRTFRFAPISRTRFEFLPGQCVNLEVQVGSELLRRSYTIASPPSRPDVLEVTVKRVHGGRVSSWLHDNLRLGDEVTLSGPIGKFSCELAPHAEKVLFISAGSGITPVMSMSRFLHDIADPRDVVFLHSARNESTLIFRDEIVFIAARNPRFRAVITLTNASGDWQGLRGRITAALIEDAVPDFRQRAVFLCGPTPFMETVRGALMGSGFPMANFYAESFGGARPVRSTPAAPSGVTTEVTPGADPASDAPAPVPTPPPEPERQRPRRSSQLLGVLPRPRFTLVNETDATSPAPPTSAPVGRPGLPAAPAGVIFSASGREVRDCAGETILEAAESLGLPLPSACRSGVCGTCKTRKLSGNVSMDCEDGLDPADRSAGFILACTAHPLDRVVVEA
jgi:ferredoxin-NADP reductase/ferredoxin